MHKKKLIIIGGKSIYLQAIASSLMQQSGADILRFDPDLPQIAQRILALQADLVILEHECFHTDLAMTLLKACLPLMVLYPRQGQVRLLTGKQSHGVGIGELTQFIEQIIGLQGFKGLMDSKA